MNGPSTSLLSIHGSPFPLAAATVSMAAASAAARWPGLAAFWFAYLLLLAPVSGFARSGYAVVADRYAYVATIPLFVALSYAVALASAAARPRAPIAITLRVALVATTVGLITLSWRLSLAWRDTDTLIARAASAGTLSRPTYLIAIGKRHERPRVRPGGVVLPPGTQIAPTRSDVADNLGGYFYRRRKLTEAVAMFELSLAIDPRFVVAYNHLGLTLAEQGRVNEAARNFEMALSLHPYYADARLNLASLLRHQGEVDQASHHYAFVLRTDPNNTRARSGLHAIAAETGRVKAP